jgi:hypothetical protein
MSKDEFDHFKKDVEQLNFSSFCSRIPSAVKG